MPGQALVDESIVGRQQLQHAAVFAVTDSAMNNCVSCCMRLAEVVVELGKGIHIGNHAGKLAELQPLAGEIVDQGL